MENLHTSDKGTEKTYSEKADIETSSENYAKRFSGKVGEYFLKVQSDITLKLLQSWPNADILDVGGGHAQLAVPLVRHKYEVTVIGSDDICRDRLDKQLPPGTFKYKTCNLLQLPFDDHSFDVVICFRLLTHEKNWQRLISELCRIAKYAVIADYPDIRSFNILYRLLFKAKKALEKDTRTYRSFSRKDILEEFKKNDFDNPTLKPEFFLPMVAHRAIKFVPFSKCFEKFFATIGLTKLFGSPVILRVKPKNQGETGQ